MKATRIIEIKINPDKNEKSLNKQSTTEVYSHAYENYSLNELKKELEKVEYFLSRTSSSTYTLFGGFHNQSTRYRESMKKVILQTLIKQKENE